MKRHSLIAAAMISVLTMLPKPSFAEDDQRPLESSAEPKRAELPVPETGRFVLLEASYSVSSLKGPEAAERQLMKFDTATGQLWIGKQLQFLDKKGRPVMQRYWEPFEQYLDAPAPIQPVQNR